MHEVNDIVYSTLPESGKIVPLKVIEVQILKRENSEEIKYKVKVPSKNEQTYCLSKFNDVFTSIEDIKDYLMNNASKAINKMVEEALSLEERYFEKQKATNTILQTDSQNSLEQEKEDEYVKVDLGNGQIGKIKPDFTA